MDGFQHDFAEVRHLVGKGAEKEMRHIKAFRMVLQDMSCMSYQDMCFGTLY